MRRIPQEIIDWCRTTILMLPTRHFHLVLSAFTFDNIPGLMKQRIFRDLAKLLAPVGSIVNLVFVA